MGFGAFLLFLHGWMGGWILRKVYQSEVLLSRYEYWTAVGGSL